MPRRSPTRGRSRPVLYDDLGFATNYTVDPEPEDPGDGEWGMREHQVLGAAQGGPIAVIRPSDADAWLLDASFGHPGALFGTPDSNRVCVMEQFAFVTLIDVRSPDDQVRLDVSAIRIGAASDEQLLLLAGWNAITAWGTDGIRWTSTIVVDDLHIRRTDNGRIVCNGRSANEIHEVEVTLDAATGAELSRTVLTN